MFRDILVPMLGELPDAAIRAAGAIAGHDGAHVDVLVGASVVTPNVVAWASCPAPAHATLRAAAEATVDAMAARARERLAREDVTTGVRRCASIWLSGAEMAALCARHADLVVLDRGSTSGEAGRQLFGGLLVGGGRPVLLVPADAPATGRFARVVLAWKPTREAARALHDALPLLWRAREVEVVAISGDEDTTDDARLLEHLAHQGVAARMVRRRRDGASSAERILEHVAAVDADLVVAGGYGHSRAREYAFGGVTEALYRDAPCAVLFSH